MRIDAERRQRLREAWEHARERLAPDDLKQIEALLRAAHDEATAAVAGTGGRRTAPGEASLVMSAIYENLTEPQLADGVVRVLPDGTILGGDKYEQLDPGWLDAIALWLHHAPPAGVVPFRRGASRQPMPDELVVGLLGDWGTGAFRHGQAGAVAAGLRAERPDIVVHLGDVYYAGTAEAERSHLLADFPAGRLASFALNSNHEMYAGGAGYFEQLLDESPLFAQQRACSYFGLENERCVIVGLDTAYYAEWKTMGMAGALCDQQREFLAACAATGKPVIVLSHHAGLDSADGSPIEPLWSQVNGALDPRRRNLWYWGHNHAGYAHRRVGPVEARCVGHGALPWGHASELLTNPTVVWSEQRRAPHPPRMMNGFALLRIGREAILEEIRDSSGRCGWSQTIELAPAR